MNIKDYKNFIEGFNFEGLVSYLDFEAYYNDLPLKYQNPQHFKNRFSSIYYENSYLLAFIRKKRDYLTDILDIENYKSATTQRLTQNQNSDTNQETTGQSQSQSQNVTNTKTTDNNSALMDGQLPEVIYNNLSLNDGSTSLNNNDLNTLKNNVKSLLESSNEAITSNKIQQIIAQLNDLDLDNLKDKYLQKFAGLFSHFGGFNFATPKLSPLSLELEDHKQEILQVFRSELAHWENQRQAITQELKTLQVDTITATNQQVLRFLNSFNFIDLINEKLTEFINNKTDNQSKEVKTHDLEAFRAEVGQLVASSILNNLNPLKSEINTINEQTQKLGESLTEKTEQLTQQIESKSQELRQESQEAHNSLELKLRGEQNSFIVGLFDIKDNQINQEIKKFNQRIDAIAKGQDFKIVWNLPTIDWDSVTVESFGNNNEDFRLFFLPDESDRLAYLSYLKTAAPFTEVKNFIDQIATKLSSWNLTTRRTIYFTDSIYAGGGVLYNEAQGFFLNQRSKYGNITNVKKSLYSFFIVWEATSPVESNKFATVQRAIVVQD